MCEQSNLRVTQSHLQNNYKIPRQIQQVWHMSFTHQEVDTRIHTKKLQHSKDYIQE